MQHKKTPVPIWLQNVVGPLGWAPCIRERCSENTMQREERCVATRPRPAGAGRAGDWEGSGDTWREGRRHGPPHGALLCPPAVPQDHHDGRLPSGARGVPARWWQRGGGEREDSAGAGAGTREGRAGAAPAGAGAAAGKGATAEARGRQPSARVGSRSTWRRSGVSRGALH